MSTHGKISKKVNNFARRAAERELRELYPETHRLLLEGWIEFYKKEFGWVDERPERNRLIAERRGPQPRVNGRFVKIKEEANDVDERADPSGDRGGPDRADRDDQRGGPAEEEHGQLVHD